MNFPADLSRFENQSRRRVNRIVPSSGQKYIHSRRAQDQIMENIEEDKKEE